MTMMNATATTLMLSAFNHIPFSFVTEYDWNTVEEGLLYAPDFAEETEELYGNCDEDEENHKDYIELFHDDEDFGIDTQVFYRWNAVICELVSRFM